MPYENHSFSLNSYQWMFIMIIILSNQTCRCMHALNTITQFVLKELPQILTIIICITTDIHGVKSHSHTQDVQRVLHGHREESHTEVLFSKSPFQQGNAALIHHKGRENSHFFVTFFFFLHQSSYQSSSAKLPSSASGTWLLERRWEKNKASWWQSVWLMCVNVQVPGLELKWGC